MLFSTSTLINQFLVTEEINQNSHKFKLKKKKKDHYKLLILYWKISHWKLWGLHFFKSYSSIWENGHFIWKSKAENVSWNNKTGYNFHKTWSQEYKPNHLADINRKACLGKNIFIQLVLYTFSIVILTA